MAYTTVDKSTTSFNSIKYTGNSSAGNITGVGLRPDWTWIKKLTDDAEDHAVFDSVRGVDSPKLLNPNAQAAEETHGNNGYISAFISDGFTVATNGSGGDEWQYLNHSGDTFIAWNWKAGGTAPTKTYTVKVVSDGGNKYRFDDFGTSAVTLDLQEGGTYTFDSSDSSVNSHPFVIGTAANGSEYSTGVTYKLDGVTKTYSQYTSGFSSASSRQLIITVPASAPALYYWCSVHSGMGGAINTNATHGHSNFDGAIQSKVSSNTTSGFSIVRWEANAGNSTGIGHGLGAAPKVIFYKKVNGSGTWYVWLNGVIDSSQDYLTFDTATKQDINSGTYGTPSATTFSNFGFSNTSQMIAYCFTDIPGYSRFGNYKGNGSTNGIQIYTGFKPTIIIRKCHTSGTAEAWTIQDDKRPGYNVTNLALFPQGTNAEDTAAHNNVDFLSNGFKTRSTDSRTNGDGKDYIYMAFGQPITGSNNVPATAR